MGQPRRAPQSPADRQAEAIADVERISRAYYEVAIEVHVDTYGGPDFPGWDAMPEPVKETYRRVTRELLRKGLIRVGDRPAVVRPLRGQTTIEEQLDAPTERLVVGLREEVGERSLPYRPVPREVYEIVVPGEPRAKGRARVTRRGGAYTDEITKQHERTIGWWLLVAKVAPFEANVSVSATFYRSNHQRIDVDNMLKAVLDGANGIAWKDDSQVTEISGRVELDAENPRTVIRLRESTSTMQRGTGVDLAATCETCGAPFSYASARRVPRYCSRHCMNNRPKDCAVCGSTFTSTSAAQKYCSADCREAAARERAPQPERAHCQVCNAPLKRRGATLCTPCWRKHAGGRRSKAALLATVNQPEEGA